MLSPSTYILKLLLAYANAQLCKEYFILNDRCTSVCTLWKKNVDFQKTLLWLNIEMLLILQIFVF